VYAIVQLGSAVYVGGDFTGFVDAGGTTIPRNNLAAFNPSLGNVAAGITAWNPNANGVVLALKVAFPNVYVGGRFTGFTQSGVVVPRNHLAATDAFETGNTGALRPWDPNVVDTIAGGSVDTIATSADGTVYVGGRFSGFSHPEGGVPVTVERNNLAALPGYNPVFPVPAIPTGWNPNVGGSVAALAITGTTVYAAGQFGGVGRPDVVQRFGLAAFDTAGDGDPLPTWNPGHPDLTLFGGVSMSALTVRDNKVYIGGNFNSLGGLSRGSFGVVDATSGAIIP
jgi:hypothetical protein